MAKSVYLSYVHTCCSFLQLRRQVVSNKSAMIQDGLYSSQNHCVYMQNTTNHAETANVCIHEMYQHLLLKCVLVYKKGSVVALCLQLISCFVVLLHYQAECIQSSNLYNLKLEMNILKPNLDVSKCVVR